MGYQSSGLLITDHEMLHFSKSSDPLVHNREDAEQT